MNRNKCVRNVNNKKNKEIFFNELLSYNLDLYGQHGLCIPMCKSKKVYSFFEYCLSKNIYDKFEYDSGLNDLLNLIMSNVEPEKHIEIKNYFNTRSLKLYKNIGKNIIGGVSTSDYFKNTKLEKLKSNMEILELIEQIPRPNNAHTHINSIAYNNTMIKLTRNRYDITPRLYQYYDGLNLVDFKKNNKIITNRTTDKIAKPVLSLEKNDFILKFLYDNGIPLSGFFSGHSNKYLNTAIQYIPLEHFTEPNLKLYLNFCFSWMILEGGHSLVECIFPLKLLVLFYTNELKKGQGNITNLFYGDVDDFILKLEILKRLFKKITIYPANLPAKIINRMSVTEKNYYDWENEFYTNSGWKRTPFKDNNKNWFNNTLDAVIINNTTNDVLDYINGVCSTMSRGVKNTIL
jgi:hypothetical protein